METKIIPKIESLAEKTDIDLLSDKDIVKVRLKDKKDILLMMFWYGGKNVCSFFYRENNRLVKGIASRDNISVDEGNLIIKKLYKRNIWKNESQYEFMNRIMMERGI